MKRVPDFATASFGSLPMISLFVFYSMVIDQRH